MCESQTIIEEINAKLNALSGKDLETVADFVDFLHKKKQSTGRKLLKLQGILKGSPIDLSDLKEFKEKSWRHLEDEMNNG